MVLAIVFFNQVSGSSMLYGYGATLFTRWLGHDSYGILELYVYWTLLQVIVTYIAGQLLERYGRRAFMM